MHKNVFKILMVVMAITLLGAVLKKPVIEPAVTATTAYMEVNYSADAAVCTIMGNPHKKAEWGDCFKMARHGNNKHDIVFEYTSHR